MYNTEITVSWFHKEIKKSQKYAWRRRVSNPGPLRCKSSALPLSYIPISVRRHNYITSNMAFHFTIHEITNGCENFHSKSRMPSVHSRPRSSFPRGRLPETFQGPAPELRTPRADFLKLFLFPVWFLYSRSLRIPSWTVWVRDFGSQEEFKTSYRHAEVG